jgi:hypothetical protein
MRSLAVELAGGRFGFLPGSEDGLPRVVAGGLGPSHAWREAPGQSADRGGREQEMTTLAWHRTG